MTATVIPFPVTRRRGFVRRHAERIAAMPTTWGRRHLDRQLEIQCETMQRRGIAPELIAKERGNLESAIIVVNSVVGRSKEVIRLDLKTEIANCRGDREGSFSLLNSLNRIISRLHKITTQIS